ncbi:hypothetical protein D3C81_2149610 [compost metagenome]
MVSGLSWITLSSLLCSMARVPSLCVLMPRSARILIASLPVSAEVVSSLRRIFIICRTVESPTRAPPLVVVPSAPLVTLVRLLVTLTTWL